MVLSVACHVALSSQPAVIRPYSTSEPTQDGGQYQQKRERVSASGAADAQIDPDHLPN